MSAEVPVVESAHVERPTKPPVGDGTFAERVLADTIDKHPGPIVREEDKFDGEGDEHAQAVAQAHVYRLLTDRSYLKLELHLESAHYVRETLGLEDVPDDSTFSNSWREQFTDGTKAFLKEYCSWVQDELEKLGIREVEPYLPDEKREHLNRPKVTDAEKRQSVLNTWGMIEDDLDFNRGPGIEWSDKYLYNVFAEGANKGITPYEVLDKERKDRDDDEDASHKAVMNAADNRTADEWAAVFDDVFDTIFGRLKAANYFTREHDAFLDGTTRPMWPSGELPEGVKGGDVKESTNYAWQFATLVVEDRGVQCPVAMVPITDERPTHKQVEELLEMADKRINIDVLKADGGYAGARCQRALQEGPVNDYILRGSRRGKQMKRHLATMTGHHDDVDSYVTTSADKQVRTESRLVAEPDWDYADDEVLHTVPDSAQQGLGAFNAGLNREAIDLNDIDKNLWRCRRPYLTSIEDEDARSVTEAYDKRWVVEDNYANTKRNQLGKTDSPNHAVQTFVWGLAMVFSAVWAAVRVFLRRDHPAKIPHDRPIISAREIVVFVKLEFG